MTERRVASSKEVREGKLLVVAAGGEKLIVTRVGGVVVACTQKCPHLGLSLARGKVVDGAVVCPFHGSRFDLTTGENLDWVNAFAGVPMPRWSHRLISLGRGPKPLARFEAVERDGEVFVDVP